jgi:hypothetical protein
MTPYRTQTAKKNLREGIRKMKEAMKDNPAAQVRRDFQLGRPPRPLAEGQNPEPLHPTVAWQRATEALADFRARMAAVGLNPQYADAAIVFIQSADQDQPHLLGLSEDARGTAYETLARGDVIALGMLFAQIDERSKQKAIFPKLFFGLSERGMAVLRRAAEIERALGELLKNVN